MLAGGGVAFVVVQHLSPDFKSPMKELLSRHTQMRRTASRTTCASPRSSCRPASIRSSSTTRRKRAFTATSPSPSSPSRCACPCTSRTATSSSGNRAKTSRDRPPRGSTPRAASATPCS
ncbi:MAG: chemotaxis protein CheB [Planctomycetota bacterium]